MKILKVLAKLSAVVLIVSTGFLAGPTVGGITVAVMAVASGVRLIGKMKVREHCKIMSMDDKSATELMWSMNSAIMVAAAACVAVVIVVLAPPLWSEALSMLVLSMPVFL